MLAPPPSDNIEDDMVVPNDTTEPYTYAWSKVQGIQKPGGSIKYADTRSFNVSKTISAAEVTVEVGGMRYVDSYCPTHWLQLTVEQRITLAPHRTRVSILPLRLPISNNDNWGFKVDILRNR